MMDPLGPMNPPPKGRGAPDNPPNRFEPLLLEPDPEYDPSEDRPVSTQFFRDKTSSIITYNDSPDIGFNAGLNPYRGCEHGCIYCYARPTHEYLGFSAGLDFESRIMVKEDAPALLRKELSARKWNPQPVAISGVTDCYPPIEKKLKLTRGCLEVLADFRNPAGLITKNHLVTRDIDLLQKLAQFQAVVVYISVTTLDSQLTPKLEPRASLPQHRLAAIESLTQAGIPVGVMLAPVIPGLTDHEIPSILAAAARAGAQFAGYVPLRLPHGVAPLFEHWLARHFPGRREKILKRIRSIRGGKLNDARFGSRMSGQGIFAEQIDQLFEVSSRKFGLNRSRSELSTSSFRIPPGRQLELFY
jgi:DNA repair photolyase